MTRGLPEGGRGVLGTVAGGGKEAYVAPAPPGTDFADLGRDGRVMEDHRSPEERLAADGITVLPYTPARPRSGDGAAPLPLVWFDRIEPSLEVMDFVQGFLIEKSAAVLYGDSNAGKTFWPPTSAFMWPPGGSGTAAGWNRAA